MSRILITIAIAILLAIIAQTTQVYVYAYTLDAKLAYAGPGLFNMGQRRMTMTNVAVTELPSSLQATSATLTDSSGEPVAVVWSDHFGYVGKIAYKMSDGSTNLVSTLFSPNYRKIVTQGTDTVITLKDSFRGIKGTLTLHGPIETATTGLVHIEGIPDPTTND